MAGVTSKLAAKARGAAVASSRLREMAPAAGSQLNPIAAPEGVCMPPEQTTEPFTATLSSSIGDFEAHAAAGCTTSAVVFPAAPAMLSTTSKAWPVEVPECARTRSSVNLSPASTPRSAWRASEVDFDTGAASDNTGDASVGDTTFTGASHAGPTDCKLEFAATKVRDELSNCEPPGAAVATERSVALILGADAPLEAWMVYKPTDAEAPLEETVAPADARVANVAVGSLQLTG